MPLYVVPPTRRPQDTHASALGTRRCGQRRSSGVRRNPDFFERPTCALVTPFQKILFFATSQFGRSNHFENDLRNIILKIIWCGQRRSSRVRRNPDFFERPTWTLVTPFQKLVGAGNVAVRVPEEIQFSSNVRLGHSPRQFKDCPSRPKLSPSKTRTLLLELFITYSNLFRNEFPNFLK